MKRTEFLQVLGIGTPGLILPSQWATSQSIKIYDNYIRGITHYDYKQLKQSIKEGDTLTLQREQDNVHDAFAIEVLFESYKLGYLAAFENIVLANMLDEGVQLQAVVSEHSRKKEIYECLSVAVYTDLLKPVNPPLVKELPKRADDNKDLYRSG